MSTAHFSITGEFLTEHARNLVLEDNHILAIKTLQTLEGFPMDSIIQVLKGNLKLIGTNEVDAVPDDDQAYKKQLRWRYDGIVKHKRDFYRPYAIVGSYGRADIGFSKTEKVCVWHTENSCSRAMFYADDQKDDLARPVDTSKMHGFIGVKACLFKKVDHVPDFIAVDFDCNEDFQRALEEAILTGRNIEVRGYSESGFAAKDAERDRELKELAAKTEADEDAKKKRLAEYEEQQKEYKRLGLDEDGLDEYGLYPTEPHAKDLLDPKFEKHRYGWVMPNGDVYSCEYQGHRDTADVICKCVLGIKSSNNPEHELEQGMCIKLGSAVSEAFIGYEYDLRGKYTQAQYDVVYEWCKKREAKFPNWIWDLEASPWDES